MKESLRIALIALSALDNIALKYLAREYPHIKVDSYSTFGSFKPFALDYRRFVVTADEFVANADFFIPRRMNTLVLCRDAKVWIGECQTNVITPGMDEADVERRFSTFISEKGSSDASAEISQRERDIIREVASGFTNKEIAERLNISVNTVTTHRKNISSKLGIRSASGLSLYAMMNGIL